MRKVEWNETSAVVPSSVWPEVIHCVLRVTEWSPAFSWTGHFECTCCARGTGLVLSRTALWYCFGDKLWPSFLRNYNCQWKKGSLPQNSPIMLVDTVPTQNAHPLVWLITLRSTINSAISNLKKKLMSVMYRSIRRLLDRLITVLAASVPSLCQQQWINFWAWQDGCIESL